MRRLGLRTLCIVVMERRTEVGGGCDVGVVIMQLCTGIYGIA